MRTFGFVLTAVVLMTLVGCNEAEKQPDPMAQRIQVLEQENADLNEKVETLEATRSSLRKNLEVLSGLPDKTRLDDLCPLESVKLTRYTGFYDKDDDGTRESLIVYVQPIDTQGDTIKTPGAIDVQLWDLAKEPDGARLGQWHVGPKELHKLWFSTLMKTNYRMIFPIPESAGKLDKPLTVKMTFTDYLTGQVFEQQHVIEPESE